MEGRDISEIESYYESLWGAPSGVIPYRAAGCEIRVLKWDADVTDQGVSLYLTSGASGVAHGKHRVEFVIGLNPAFDAVGKSLAALATFPLLSGPIGKGETVTLPDPILPGSKMCTYLVIPRVGDFVSKLALDDGSHVEVLPVAPMYESELALKKEHGAAWFMRRLTEQGLSISDPFRRPIR